MLADADPTGNLSQLDKFLSEKLVASIRARKPPHLKKKELVEVVFRWKSLRGVPRPFNKKYLLANSEEAVRDASAASFGLALSLSSSHRSEEDNNDEDSDGDDEASEQSSKKVKDAMSALTSLKGVGPASASVVLGVLCPKSFVYMDDEVILFYAHHSNLVGACVHVLKI